jgi:hypothetical protein
MEHLRALVHVGIVLATAGPLTPGETAALKREASAIWQPYGVALTWFDRGDDCSAAAVQEWLAPVDVLLHIATDASAPERADGDEPLGFVRFIRGVPSHTVYLRHASLERFVLAAHVGRWPVGDLQPSLRDEILGRALGRVLAHEVGHVLLAMPSHADSGLMRAGFAAEDLVAAHRERLRLNRSAVMRLARRGDGRQAVSP